MASPDRPNPVIPMALAWLLPGAGHLRLGRRWPALFVAVAVLGLYVGGMALAGFENVSPTRHRWFYLLHVLCALPTGVATLLTRDVQLTAYPPHKDVGELYTAVGALLNLVAVADVWARCRRGDPEAARGPAEPLTPRDLVGTEEA